MAHRCCRDMGWDRGSAHGPNGLSSWCRMRLPPVTALRRISVHWTESCCLEGLAQLHKIIRLARLASIGKMMAKMRAAVEVEVLVKVRRRAIQTLLTATHHGRDAESHHSPWTTTRMTTKRILPGCQSHSSVRPHESRKPRPRMPKQSPRNPATRTPLQQMSCRAQHLLPLIQIPASSLWASTLG